MINNILEQKLESSSSTPAPEGLVYDTFCNRIDQLYNAYEHRYIKYYGKKHTQSFLENFKRRLLIYLTEVEIEDLCQNLELLKLEAQAQYSGYMWYVNYRERVINLIQQHSSQLLVPYITPEEISRPFLSLDYILSQDWLNLFQKQLIVFRIERDWTLDELATFYETSRRNISRFLDDTYSILRETLDPRAN